MEVRPAMKLTASVSVKVAKPRAALERPMIAAMEAAPSFVAAPAFTASPRIRAKVAPPAAVMVVAPAVVVEIDPCGIVKIEKRAPVERRPVESVEPGTRSDEYAACEPLGSVIAIRRAPVGCVGIVAVGANWSRADVRRRAHSDCDSYAHLRVCRTCHRSCHRDRKSRNCRVP